MKAELDQLISKIKNIQDQATSLVKDMDIVSQIKSVANKYQAEVKTVLQADRNAVEKGIEKARNEVQKLVKLLPNIEEGQAILASFLNKPSVDKAVNRVGKKAARKVKVGVRAATKAVKAKARPAARAKKN